MKHKHIHFSVIVRLQIGNTINHHGDYDRVNEARAMERKKFRLHMECQKNFGKTVLVANSSLRINMVHFFHGLSSQVME